jgi:diguanylate cyclase (GGDEF)-like protein
MTRRSPLALLRWLAEPNIAIAVSNRRRARLLAWIQLALLALVAIALPVILVVTPAAGPQHGRYSALMLLFVIVLAAAYALIRSGHYLSSAWLTIGATAAGSWASVAFENTIFNGNLIPLTYTVLPIFLASILLSVPATAVLALGQISALIGIKVLDPGANTDSWPSVVLFVFFLSVLSVVAAIITRQDLEQIERQSLQLIESEGHLREQSVRDMLTGLFNRRYLEETLERELRRAERAKAPLGVMMIDIDHFKHYNDTYGHAVGDALLRELGALLRASVRDSDVACRYGGEEFILLLPEATLDVSHARAERIRASAAQIQVLAGGQPVEPVTLSIGLAEFPQDGATDQALLKRADDALYRAKHEGRNQIA